jgi:predicted acetyltransferase
MNPPHPLDTSITAAGADDLARIENLMQFYNYDMSEWLPVDFGPNGLYPIRSKQRYWQQRGVQPYLARVGGELAGFAVVDDECLEPGPQFNVGYFFVARRYRGRGLGHRLAEEVFSRHPGTWQAYHYTCNEPARRFWPKAILRAGGSGLVTRQVVADGSAATLYEFSTAAR